MLNQLKVLHLNASDSGGAFMFSENLVNGFKNQNQLLVEQLIFTGENNNFIITRIRKIDDFIKFIIHAFEKFILYSFLNDKKYLFKFSLGWPGIKFWLLNKYLKKYDIIHLHWINKGYINLSVLKKINKPIVWTCHDIWIATGGCHLTYGCKNFENGCGYCPMLKSNRETDLSRKLFLKKVKLLSDVKINFIAPSQWLANELVKSEILKNQQVQVINNGINTNVFKCNNTSLKEDKVVIGFVAQNLNDENKSLNRLVKAINLIENKSKYELLLIGAQKKEFEIPIQIDYKVVSDADTINKMSNWYNQMDILVCTSTIETFPTTLMEAACCGVKCIGFDVGGVKEILEVCNGITLPPFDINQLYYSIRSFEKSSSNKMQISKVAIQSFSIETTLKEYFELYKKIIPLN